MNFISAARPRALIFHNCPPLPAGEDCFKSGLSHLTFQICSCEDRRPGSSLRKSPFGFHISYLPAMLLPCASFVPRQSPPPLTFHFSLVPRATFNSECLPLACRSCAFHISHLIFALIHGSSRAIIVLVSSSTPS